MFGSREAPGKETVTSDADSDCEEVAEESEGGSATDGDGDDDDASESSQVDGAVAREPGSSRCISATQTSTLSGATIARVSGTPRAFDVLLVTYTLFDRSSESSRLDRAFLRRYHFQAVVLDEGDSQQGNICRLTGTLHGSAIASNPGRTQRPQCRVGSLQAPLRSPL